MSTTFEDRGKGGREKESRWEGKRKMVPAESRSTSLSNLESSQSRKGNGPASVTRGALSFPLGCLVRQLGGFSIGAESVVCAAVSPTSSFLFSRGVVSWNSYGLAAPFSSRCAVPPSGFIEVSQARTYAQLQQVMRWIGASRPV